MLLPFLENKREYWNPGLVAIPNNHVPPQDTILLINKYKTVD